MTTSSAGARPRRPPDHELFLEHHLSFFDYEAMLAQNPENAEFFRNQGFTTFSHTISDAVSELWQETIALSDKVANQVAKEALLYGAGRRIKIMLQGARELWNTIPADRMDPLLHSENDVASRSLNDIYLHVLGVLDNYSQALGNALAPVEFERLRRVERTLTGKRFLELPGLEQLGLTTRPYREWINNLKKLRDPVAHRIPLTLPPSVLDEDTLPEYERAAARHRQVFENPPALPARVVSKHTINGMSRCGTPRRQ